MKISSINSNSYSQNFKARKTQRNNNEIDSFIRTPRKSLRETNNYNYTMQAATALAILSMVASGLTGYKLGTNESDKESYLAGFQDGVEATNKKIEEEQQALELAQILEEIENTPAPTPYPTPVIANNTQTPEAVYDIAPDKVTRINLEEKPYLFKDSSELPIYFPDNGIDREILRKAQDNFANLYRSGSYLIISPKYDTTMGEIKKVFGIIDEALGKEEVNKMQEREHIPGSNGNMDNAIVYANEAIRIRMYDNEKGHQIGVYAAHKSNKSRQEIADCIIEWANK